MFVTRSNFDDALKKISDSAKKDKALGFDTEAKTLHWWKSPWHEAYGIKPGIFSMQFATKNEEFYFDWLYDDNKLDESHFQILDRELFQNPETLWFIANAKYDLHQIANYGIRIQGTVHCTRSLARVVNNREPNGGMSLDALSKKYLGAGKFMDMAQYCKENGLVTKIKKFGHNEKFDDCLHFDRIPQAPMVEYGLIDARRVFDLGVYQVKEILRLDKEIFEKLEVDVRLSNVMKNEHKLIKIFFEMEREGVKIDRAYTEEAYEYEVAEYRRIEGELDRIGKAHGDAKIDWNSAKQLKPIFDAMGEPYSYTEKGNASFDKDALEESDSEIAKLILKYRFHYKRAHTYFENFIWLADSDNILHCDFQPNGTMFGRPSCWTPNLQNVPKKTDKDESNYKVRRCFIPKDGFFFADFDYKGAEYYMGIDYARETTIADELKAGIDPHRRLADEMGIPDRDNAKTMQFRIFYGGGGAAVGRELGYKGAEADRIGKEKKKLYFQRVPRLHEVMVKVGGGWFQGRRITGVAEARGFIFNWLGRILYYDRDTAYKAFNGLIQGGVGDLTKTAMIEVDEKALKGRKTKMLLQIYDALLLEMHPDDIDLIPKIKDAMTTVYPHKILPMQADAGFSEKSWADLTPKLPALT